MISFSKVMVYNLVRTVEDIRGKNSKESRSSQREMHRGAKSDLIEWNWQILWRPPGNLLLTYMPPNCPRLRIRRKTSNPGLSLFLL